MIRFDVLARLGKTDTLVKELKTYIMPESIHGPGHSMKISMHSAAAMDLTVWLGALIVNQVLGLGQPMQLTRTIRINPHPGELNWACGSAVCADGRIFFEWKRIRRACLGNGTYSAGGMES